MHQIFVSYSSKDAVIANELVAAVEASGLKCWIAPRDEVAGAFWSATITQAIKNAKAFVILLSGNSNESRQVAREVHLADEFGVAAITVMLEKVRLSAALAFYISIFHWIDKSGKADQDFNIELINTLRNRLNEYNAKTGQQEKGVMLDIFDDLMDWVGVAKRDAAHRLGLWHKTFHCWFVSREGDAVFVYLQKRSMLKKDFPGLYDITAARHLQPDEQDRDGIGRIVEELGVAVDFEDVVYMGVRTFCEDFEAFHNREYNGVYLYPSPYGLPDFDPNPKEAEGIVKLDANTALAMLSGETDQATATCVFVTDEGRKIRKVTLKAEDLVPRADDYYHNIFTSAIAYFAGQPLRL
jgi:isopentenyldiphosphate isomerase